LLALLTVDVEQDCPPYLDTFHGVEYGLPNLLELLDKIRLKSTFFWTSTAARRFPTILRRTVDAGHEIGSHGFNHERLDKIPVIDGYRLVSRSIRDLESLTGMPVKSFRPPNLVLPRYYVKVLAHTGIEIDSSIATYKPPFIRKPYTEANVLRVPVSLTSSILRLPLRIVTRILKLMKTRVLVLFVHSWEFIDMRGRVSRVDCTFSTGAEALRKLHDILVYLKSRGYRFVTMSELSELLKL